METAKEYQISSSVNDRFLEVVVTGNAIDSEFEKMMNEVDSILKANRAKKAIFDIRAIGGRLPHTELYRFVRNHPSIIYEIPSAIVDIPKTITIRLHQNMLVCHGNGLPISILLEIGS